MPHPCCTGHRGVLHVFTGSGLFFLLLPTHVASKAAGAAQMRLVAGGPSSCRSSADGKPGRPVVSTGSPRMPRGRSPESRGSFSMACSLGPPQLLGFSHRQVGTATPSQSEGMNALPNVVISHVNCFPKKSTWYHLSIRFSYCVVSVLCVTEKAAL